MPWIKLHTRSIFIYTPIKSTGTTDGRYSKGQIPDNRYQQPPLLPCPQSLPVSVIQEGTPQTTVHVPLMPSSCPLLLYIMQKQNPVFSHIGQAVLVGGIYYPSLHPFFLISCDMCNSDNVYHCYGDCYVTSNGMTGIFTAG